MDRYRAIKGCAGLALCLAVASVLAHAFPGLVGADYSYIVQTGSMEPAIGTGSVIFVADVPPETIEEGDIITFAESGAGRTTTHRVVEKHQAGESLRFTTKGDANEDPDPEPVYRSDVVGKATFSIPLLGYLIGFAQTRLGWITLVVVPVIALIASELWQLYDAIEIVDGDGS